MARDLSVEVREAIVERLNTPGSATLAKLTEPRAYGPSLPKELVWPFTRTDLPVVTPDPDGCGPGGTRYTFRVHGFAKGNDERNGAQLGAAIAADLDEFAEVIVADPEAAITDTVWTGTQVFRDTDEADGWHAVVSLYCRVSG